MNNNFKGTPGNWTLVSNDYGYYTSVRNLDDTRKVCVSRVNNQIESNANMLLISKAPEMLEMLVKISDECDGNNFSIFRDEIDQLIKQATDL